MRDSIAPVSCAAAKLRATFDSRCNDNGVSQSDDSAVRTSAQDANSRTGRATLALDMPDARIAVISLSVDIRLRPIRMPTSTPSGSAKGIVDGKAYRNSFATTGPGADTFTSSAERCSMVRKNSTKINNRVPSIALVNTSLKIDLLRMRIELLNG